MWDFRNFVGFWAATALAVLSVLLVIVDGWLVTSNASLRTTVSTRQQFINQSVQLSRLNQELVNELGSFALKNNVAIRKLLADSGITVVGQAQQPAAEQAAPASSAIPPVKKP